MSKPLKNYEGVAPCCICGEYPVLRGGDRVGRLECPNFDSSTIIHGRCGCETQGIPMGFTSACFSFWSKEQEEKEGIPTLIAAWNKIHMGRKYNGER